MLENDPPLWTITNSACIALKLWSHLHLIWGLLERSPRAHPPTPAVKFSPSGLKAKKKPQKKAEMQFHAKRWTVNCVWVLLTKKLSQNVTLCAATCVIVPRNKINISLYFIKVNSTQCLICFFYFFFQSLDRLRKVKNWLWPRNEETIAAQMSFTVCHFQRVPAQKALKKVHLGVRTWKGHPRIPQRLVFLLGHGAHKAPLKRCREECFTLLPLAPASCAAASLTLANVCRAARGSPATVQEVGEPQTENTQEWWKRGLFINISRAHQRVVYSLDQEQVNLCFTLLCFFCIFSAFNLAIAWGVKCGFALNALSVWTH